MANGLVTKNTDLKSLKYGSMPFGGTTPYVTKDINNPPTSNITGMQLQKRLDDTSRIAQMLVDKPGLKFLANQALLQQTHTADKLSKASNIGKQALSIVKNTVVDTAKVALSTLAQVPVNGTGTHFLQGFRTNTYLQPAGGNTRSGFAQFFGAGGVEGAPYALKGENIPGQSPSAFVNSQDSSGKVQNPKNGNSSTFEYAAPVRDSSTGFDLNWNEVPNVNIPDTLTPLLNSAQSKQGNVVKVSKQEKVTTTTQQSGTVIGEDGPIILAQTNTATVEEPTKETTATKGDIGIPNTGLISNKTDITEQFTNRNSDSSTYIQEKKSYSSKNKHITKEARVLLGDQGARRDEYKKSNAYWKTSVSEEEIDTINSLSPNKGKVDGETKGRDLIKFRFHILTADGVETVLYFRAFLDSFADNYSAQWNPVKYLGRAEDFQIYGGFQRKISLSFKIAAATRSEMAPLYEKMIWLASATAPTYTSTGQFMRGTITKITVGDYIYELPGVLNSVNYNWNVEYPWEIAMTEPEGQGKDDFEQELPMVMDCIIDFTPIHTFTPTTGLQKYITSDVTGNTKKALTGIGATPNTGT